MRTYTSTDGKRSISVMDMPSIEPDRIVKEPARFGEPPAVIRSKDGEYELYWCRSIGRYVSVPS